MAQWTQRLNRRAIIQARTGILLCIALACLMLHSILVGEGLNGLLPSSSPPVFLFAFFLLSGSLLAGFVFLSVASAEDEGLVRILLLLIVSVIWWSASGSFLATVVWVLCTLCFGYMVHFLFLAFPGPALKEEWSQFRITAIAGLPLLAMVFLGPLADLVFDFSSIDSGKLRKYLESNLLGRVIEIAFSVGGLLVAASFTWSLVLRSRGSDAKAKQAAKWAVEFGGSLLPSLALSRGLYYALTGARGSGDEFQWIFADLSFLILLVCPCFLVAWEIAVNSEHERLDSG